MAPLYRMVSSSVCPITGFYRRIKRHSLAKGGAWIRKSVPATLQTLPSIGCVWLISFLP